MRKSCLVVIPAYNEENTVAHIVHEAKKHGAVLVIDDGSTDNTYMRALTAGAYVIAHYRNMGYGKSIKDGFVYADSSEYTQLITIDSDGQHDPSEIPKFLDALKTSDVVVGNRFMDAANRTPKYRQVGIKALNVLSVSGDSQCGFRAYNRKAINIISTNLYENGMGASLEILKLVHAYNLKLTEIPCTIKYTENDKHSQNPISHGLDLLAAFAWWMIWEKPSKTLFPLGLFLLIGAIVTGAQTISLYTQLHVVVQSWAMLSITLLLCTMIIFNILIFVLVFKHKKVN